MAKRATKISIQSGIRRPMYAELKKEAKHFKREFERAMYYIHYEVSDKKLKASVLTYLKSNKLDYKSADAVAPHHFTIVGKVCHIVNNGGEVPDNWKEFIDTRTVELVDMGKALVAQKKGTEEKDEKPVHVIGIQDRMRDQAADVSGEFEGWIDEFMDNPASFKPDNYDPYKVLVSADMKAGHARWVVKFYKDLIEEITAAIAGADDSLKEGYGDYKKPQLKRFLKMLESINTAAETIISSSKATRKPRKRKSIDIDKVVSKLKYKKTDPALGIASINPRDIIGAQELWVYNTKSRKIGKYIAVDGAGLGVKSATILNFSAESVEKTLRKPPEQIKAFKSSGKVALRKFMGNIKTMDIKLKSRLNDNHILLKVVK